MLIELEKQKGMQILELKKKSYAYCIFYYVTLIICVWVTSKIKSILVLNDLLAICGNASVDAVGSQCVLIFASTRIDLILLVTHTQMIRVT